MITYYQQSIEVITYYQQSIEVITYYQQSVALITLARQLGTTQNSISRLLKMVG